MPDKKTQKIAEERIRILFKNAEEIYSEDPVRSQYYVDLARRIAMRSRVHIPPELRDRICSKCKAYLMPGVTSRTRIRQHREPHVATTCLECGFVHRVPLRSRQ
jgi:ribonuclease P protein subunit RPR2